RLDVARFAPRTDGSPPYTSLDRCAPPPATPRDQAVQRARWSPLGHRTSLLVVGVRLLHVEREAWSVERHPTLEPFSLALRSSLPALRTRRPTLTLCRLRPPPGVSLR